MKKVIIFMAFALVAALMIIPVGAEAVDLGDAGDVPEDTVGSSEDTERFNEVMTELYEYWQKYTETEGDTGFEKVVNFAWKYRGDIGGVVSAVAVTVFLLVMALRFMPCLKRYFEYIYKGNVETKDEIMNGVVGEISKYAPALATVEAVSAMYPKIEALIGDLTEENRQMKEQVAKMGEQVAETERRHAAEMKLQGETFKDIITLSALPVGKKNEILEKYRVIESGEPADEGATE